MRHWFDLNDIIGSEDGKVTCGYSSYIGMRPTMEDCYDIKSTKIDGQAVDMFGVFDGITCTLALLTLWLLSMMLIWCFGALGHGGNFAAEYLKENLFENLMKHPKFLKNTKLAISNLF
jgi:protein phosphatase 1L